MSDGKRSTADRIFYKTSTSSRRRRAYDPLKIFKKAIDTSTES